MTKRDEKRERRRRLLRERKTATPKRRKWLDKVIARLHRQIRRLKHAAKLRNAWGGSRAVGEKAVQKVSHHYDVSITSRKRAPYDPLSQANPSSDHNEANETAYAWDLGTYNGAGIAHRIAQELGIQNYSTGNYTSYFVMHNGRRYRVQILWAVEGHYNHVHVGIRLV